MTARVNIHLTWEAFCEVIASLLEDSGQMPEGFERRDIAFIGQEHLRRVVVISMATDAADPDHPYRCAEGAIPKERLVTTVHMRSLLGHRDALADACAEAGGTLAELQRLRAIEARLKEALEEEVLDKALESAPEETRKRYRAMQDAYQYALTGEMAW